MKKWSKYYSGNPNEKTPGRTRNGWENNIKMNFKYTGRLHSCVVLNGRIGFGGGVPPIFFSCRMVTFIE
jgi:hypothetical protein